MSQKMGRTMAQKFMQGTSAALAVVCSALFSLPAGAQAVSLQEQLQAQYKYVKMGSDTSGYSVIDKGTLLEIKKGGILAVPYSDQNLQNTKYENGEVHTPNSNVSKVIGFGMKKFGKEQTTHLFQSGDKVYPQNIAVDPNKDQVAVSIVACDSCNKTDPPTAMKAKVIFQFPKGSLAKAQAGEIEDKIGELLAMSDDQGGGNQQASGGQDQGQQQGDQQQAGGQQGGGQDQGQAQGGGGGQQPQQQADPQTVEKGMTPDQVTSALGKPTSIFNVGQKQIYVYKDMNMKITFVNGKVTDVQ
jgi:hypothetical protein